MILIMRYRVVHVIYLLLLFLVWNCALISRFINPCYRIWVVIDPDYTLVVQDLININISGALLEKRNLIVLKRCIYFTIKFYFRLRARVLLKISPTTATAFGRCFLFGLRHCIYKS